MRVVVGDATLHGTALVSEVGAARESYTAVVDHDVTMPKIAQHCDVQRFGCVFRTNVTGLFGIVTGDFGNVTGHSGNVTERTGRQDWRCA
jgi:hypothetical protein